MSEAVLGMFIVRHVNPRIRCRTCGQPFKENEWVFAGTESDTRSMEWHRDCSTREYQAAFDARLAELEANR